MTPARSREDSRNLEGDSTLLRPPDMAAAETTAWELVDVGRYMPRRIRGSFRGRELG